MVATQRKGSDALVFQASALAAVVIDTPLCLLEYFPIYIPRNIPCSIIAKISQCSPGAVTVAIAIL